MRSLNYLYYCSYIFYVHIIIIYLYVCTFIRLHALISLKIFDNPQLIAHSFIFAFLVTAVSTLINFCCDGCQCSGCPGIGLMPAPPRGLPGWGHSGFLWVGCPRLQACTMSSVHRENKYIVTSSDSTTTWLIISVTI